MRNRTPLAKVLPLRQPFLVQIFPVYACNFHCSYCLHGLPAAKHGDISHQVMMDWQIYHKCIDDMRQFTAPVKMLRFAGLGEPLLHPDIAPMIALAKEAGIADSVEIVTNGSLLTHELSDSLINAGLDRLRISLEGLSGEDYLQNCGHKVDFDALCGEIAYFYSRCTQTQVYIKIIDYMVREPQKNQTFFDRFTPLCHEIAVEHLTPTVEGIDYGSIAPSMSLDRPQNEDSMVSTAICPQPFYLCQIGPDGRVVPCCATRYPLVLGDLHQQPLPEIWNGTIADSIRRALLDGTQSCEVCRDCSLYLYGMHTSDRLDGDTDRLKSLYEKR